MKVTQIVNLQLWLRHIILLKSNNYKTKYSILIPYYSELNLWYFLCLITRFRSNKTATNSNPQIKIPAVAYPENNGT